jgi:hypothetical protein
MHEPIRFALLASALSLVACGREAPPEDRAQPEVTGSATAAPSPDVASTPAPTAPAASPTATPDMTPPVLIPEAEKGVTGARNVLLSFARAIELRQFDQAWAMLSESDRQKWSKAAFARQFADLGKITVAAPTGTTEGAAGSIYYSAPVTITANDRDGRPVRYEGEAVLRRVNDVDGATAAQLRWHFDHLTLDWTH